MRSGQKPLQGESDPRPGDSTSPDREPRAENESGDVVSKPASRDTSNIRLVGGQLPSSAEILPQPKPEDIPDGSAEVPREATSSSLNLSDAIAISLSQNPDLLTIRGTANVGAAAVDVAGVYPWNPFVQAQYLPNGHPYFPGSPGNAVGQSSYYVWVMQRFELAHQTRFREDSAVAALGQIQWNIQQAELLNIAQTERLFFTALYQRHLLDLAADSAVLNDRLTEIIDRRFQAGLATNVQHINAHVAARQTRRQRELADAAYQAALLALRQQLGTSPNAAIEVQDDLKEYAWFSISDAVSNVSGTAPTDPELLALRVSQARPDVMASRMAIGMAQANLSLARAARVPDVQAGPIYTTADDGTQYLGIRLQRDIRVFNNGNALVCQRQTEVGQQRLTHEQLRRRAANEAAAAIDRYERARALVAKAAEESFSGPPLELEQMLREFEAGQAQIVDILAVQNNLLQEERSYLDLLNEVAQAAAQVTQTTAIPPARLVAQRPPRFTAPDAP